MAAQDEFEQAGAGASAAGPQVRVTENGPYVVTGAVPLAEQTIVADASGTSRGWQEGRAFPVDGEYRLCRCGQSATKPFCDDSHLTSGFDGTETALRVAYLEQAGEQDGPEVTLTDAQRLCAFARFCDADGSIWNQVDQPGHAGQVAEEAGMCVGGRLVAWQLADDSATALEPAVPAAIGVVQDPQEGVSGGYRVWGGIPVVAADGHAYEVRNRVALCRCGGSRNKPFCDGTHASLGFTDA